MAKRFTATEKWQKAWFRKLTPKMKCLWFFLTESCDVAGVWDVDLELASFVIGEKITENDLKMFSDRLMYIEPQKIWLVDFIEFQYGELSPDCNPHKPILQKVKKYNLDLTLKLPLINPSQRVEEKEQDKDMDKEQDQEEDKEQEKDVRELEVVSEYSEDDAHEIEYTQIDEDGNKIQKSVKIGLKPVVFDVEIWPTFDDFWDAYDKKIDRKRVEPVWYKLTQEIKELVMKHVPAYVDSTPVKKLRKNPLSYLNAEAWNNEIINPNINDKEPGWTFGDLADSLDDDDTQTNIAGNLAERG